MKENQKSLLISLLFAIMAVLLAYITFMSMQALLTLVSKEGKVILPFIGPIFAMLESVALFAYLYRISYENENLSFTTTKVKAITHIIFSSITIIFMLVNIFTYKNWKYGGPTLLYPFDFLIIGILGLFIGIFELIKKYTIKTQEKSSIIITILKYIYAYVALERLGCALASLPICLNKYFFFLLLPNILCLIPILNIISKLIINKIGDEKIKNILSIVIPSVLLILGIISITYIVSMLHGDNATEYMKLISYMYGLDRLISIPISLIASTIIILIPNAISIVIYIKNLFKKVN